MSVQKCVFTVGMILLAAGAHASLVGYEFTGQVTDDAINGCGVLVDCGAVRINFDAEGVPDANPDPTLGLYEASNASLWIDGVLFFSSATGFVNVANFPTVDQFGLLATGTASNGSTAELSLLLTDPLHSAFSSGDLPVDPSVLAALLPGSFTLFATDDAFQLQGTVTEVGRGLVPEPSSVVLVGMGLLLSAAGRRFKSSQNTISNSGGHK